MRQLPTRLPVWKCERDWPRVVNTTCDLPAVAAGLKNCPGATRLASHYSGPGYGEDLWECSGLVDLCCQEYYFGHCKLDSPVQINRIDHGWIWVWLETIRFPSLAKESWSLQGRFHAFAFAWTPEKTGSPKAFASFFLSQMIFTFATLPLNIAKCRPRCRYLFSTS